MSSYKIISDTACDIFPSIINTDEIPRVPFYVSFDKENYHKEVVELSIDDFYKHILEDKVFPKTSCPTITDYTSVFDSIQATAGMGLIVYQSYLMMKDGYTFEENVSIINKLKHDVAIYFTVGTLDFLQNGGRIGKATALAGTIFNVKPIICMREGELSPVENVRGNKKAVKAIMDRTDKEIKGHESDYYISMFYADERVPIMDTIVEHYSDPKYTFSDNMFRVGVTVGAHTGPHVIAIAFSKKYTLYDK